MYKHMLSSSDQGNYAPAFAASRERLIKLTPHQIVESSLCRFNQEKSCFLLDSFGQTFEIIYPEGDLSFAGQPEKIPLLEWRLPLLNYLSAAKPIPLTGEWVTYRDLPQGNVFYPSIRNFVLEPLARFYSGCNRKALVKGLKQLEFNFIDTKADLAVKGLFTPRIPMLVQFWEGEDEIPASSQILFDSSAGSQMHIEDAAAICTLVKTLITGQHDHVLQELGD
ncbi:MAG: DUF3786 domain-containing protein [Clostridia bacterium]|nr:DUF3786 domain-containing protein [Clostridia bacterium]